MARRVVRKESRRRGLLGHIIKWAFILFNILMIVWLFDAWGGMSHVYNQGSDEFERAGAAIGMTLGTGVILMFWAAGSVVLGILVILTRGKTVIVESVADDDGWDRVEWEGHSGWDDDRREPHFGTPRRRPSKGGR